MKKAELHLITVGNSLISNYQKVVDDPKIKRAGMGDEIWSELIKRPLFLKGVYDFLCDNPKENSAELNSFLRYCEERKIKPQMCEIYLPRGDELKVLEILSDKKPKSGKEFEELINKYADEIVRLEHYGLVEVERDEFGKACGIRITNKGSWACGYLI